MIKTLKLTIALLLLTTAGLFSQNETGMALRRHAGALTADSLMGRGAGSRGEKIAAAYIGKVFQEAGLDLLYPQPGQDFSIVNSPGDTLHSANIIAVAEGYDPAFKEEFILIGAHYDHLGSYTANINGKDTVLFYPGADDNASGVAVMLEVAKMIKAQAFKFKRTVIFAAFGAEERGMLGSWYFANRGFGQKDKISLMINLDMVGRGQKGDGLHVYTIMPHAELVTLLKDVADQPLMVTPSIHTTPYFPSDHQVFSSEGIPVALFTTGLHRDYHSLRDRVAELDYVTMEMTAQYVFELALSSANMERPLSRTSLALQPDEPGKAGETKEENKLYKNYETDVPAKFLQGGEQQFLDRWVYKYIKYPQSAVEKGIQGRVLIEFTIDKEGKVKDVEVIKSLDYDLDEAAVKAISASPDWKPARKGNRAVAVRIAVPVEFRLKR
jgi:TonB family protein